MHCSRPNTVKIPYCDLLFSQIKWDTVRKKNRHREDPSILCSTSLGIPFQVIEIIQLPVLKQLNRRGSCIAVSFYFNTIFLEIPVYLVSFHYPNYPILYIFFIWPNLPDKSIPLRNIKNPFLRLVKLFSILLPDIRIEQPNHSVQNHSA